MNNDRSLVNPLCLAFDLKSGKLLFEQKSLALC